MRRLVSWGLLALCPALALTPDELTVLRDPGGWEYQTITNTNGGFQTQSSCFDKASKGQCRATLVFHEDGTFTQNLIVLTGRDMHRGGRYKIAGNELTFWDEHNTQDGPYTITLDQDANILRIERSKLGVGIRMELLLEREYKKHH